MVKQHGIQLKKKYGQNFLKDQRVINHMIDAVTLDSSSSVFEIGCGDGFLSKAIIATSVARLHIFEIDSEWAEYIQKIIQDPRLEVSCTNFLDVPESTFIPHAPWTVLANLPYHITFPILYKFHAHRHLIKEGVVMVQEEVAQKIVKKGGKDYGYPSLFLQWYFEIRLLDKIPPSAFIPSPKVFSRLMYFKPRTIMTPIPQEDAFWRFIKICFKQPRRTIANNLKQSHFTLDMIPSEYHTLRAQQLNMEQLLDLWRTVIMQTTAGSCL